MFHAGGFGLRDSLAEQYSYEEAVLAFLSSPNVPFSDDVSNLHDVQQWAETEFYRLLLGVVRGLNISTIIPLISTFQ